MIIFLVFSHDYSEDERYTNINYYKTMEKKTIEYYKNANVQYRLIKYNPNINLTFEEKDNTFYIKGNENYDFETCNYKSRTAFNYYKDKYNYIYKSTVTSLPNIKMIHTIIKEFENGNLEFLYSGPIFSGNNKWFIGGFSLLLNNKSIDTILQHEWVTHDDESIGDILRSYMLSQPYFANHSGWSYDHIHTKLVIKFVMYKEYQDYESDYTLHDKVSNIFLSLL